MEASIKRLRVARATSRCKACNKAVKKGVQCFVGIVVESGKVKYSFGPFCSTSCYEDWEARLGD